MKKTVLLLVLALALAFAWGALAEEGTPRALTTDERYELGVFLSNFTEQAFTAYDAGTSDAALSEFAAMHLWFNRRNAWEQGSWAQGAFRVSAGELPAVCARFFGRAPANLAPLYLGFDGAYVYRDVEGPGDTRGFACVSEALALGDGLYRVYFGAYGAGETWTNEDCRLRPEQAAKRYAQAPVYTGSALIRSRDGSLTDRQAFILLALVID